MSGVIAQLFVNGVFAGSLFALVGLGFVLEYRVSRAFNFAYAGAMAVGAYSCWAILHLGAAWRGGIGAPLLLAAAAAGTTVAGAFGWLLERCAFRLLRRRRATSLVLLLASLGVLAMVQNVISLVVGDDTKVLRSVARVSAISLSLPVVGAVRLTTAQVGVIATGAFVGVALALLVGVTDWGRQVRAVANDVELATIVGIPVDKIHAQVRGLGGALAGMAGIWTALDTDLTPVIGFRPLVMVSVAMVIGGLGSVTGVVIGSLVVGLVQNLGVLFVETKWQDSIAFVLLLAFLVFRPQGLLGRAS